MGFDPRLQRRKRGRLSFVSVALVSVLVAGSAAAQPVFPGFSDGSWEGVIEWSTFVRFEDTIGYADSAGLFSVTWQGGIPDGRFEYVASDVVGATEESRAELTIRSAGYFAGRATEPLLVPNSMSVTGEVLVYGIDRFPIDPIDFGTGGSELSPIELNISRADCTIANGTFTSTVASASADLAAMGGSLIVSEAHWSAVRKGDDGTSVADQTATMSELLKDATALSAAIDDGTFDGDALNFLVHRAAQIAGAIRRNESCNIGNPGLYTTTVAGVVAEILSKMIAKEDLFSLSDFWFAVIAGVESGVLGSSAGAADDELILGLKNVLRDRFAAAAAAGNKADLQRIGTLAALINDRELMDLVVEAWSTP